MNIIMAVMANNYEIRFGPNLTPGVKQLIIVNTVIFIFQLVFNLFDFKRLVSYFELNPNMVNHFYFYQLFSYGFLHANPFHILFNMLYLWFFGSEIEELWGKNTLYFVHFTSIIMGGILTCLVHNLGWYQGRVVGASGGVFGLMVLYAFLWPNRELLFLGIFPVKIKILMPILIILGMFYGGDNVAHFAHLGGIITGASFFFLKVKKKWDFHFSISRYLQKRRMLKWQEEMYKKQHVKESVDEILDKISKKGMKSLTKKEKEFLKDASKYYNE